jgi:hypothetical protein
MSEYLTLLSLISGSGSKWLSKAAQISFSYVKNELPSKSIRGGGQDGCFEIQSCRIKTRTHSEMCILRWFCHFVSIIECSYTTRAATKVTR